MRRTCLALATLAATAGCAGGDPPPNLLLVTVDTLRADRLLCYGGSAGAGLCALFEEGLRYRWAFSSAPATAPAIASLLTSRYPADHGVEQPMSHRLGDDAVTAAERLRAAGYATAAFVSNPALARSRNFAQGFDVYDDHMTQRERNRRALPERDAAATTDAALAWARLDAAEPWFLWVHFQDPHGPYDPPGAAPVRDPPGARRLPVLADPSGAGGIPDYQALPGLFSAPAYEARYRAEIRHLDRHGVRLVRSLDALGRRPVVILTADHGEAFGEDDYWFAHGHSLGLDQIHVPLLVRGQTGSGTRVVDEPVAGIDVAPTLLALAGVAPPEAFRGRALPGVASPVGTGAERVLFADHPRRAAVIHRGRLYARRRDDAPERSRERRLPPARVAALDGGAPVYRPPGAPGDADLEALLAARLAATTGAPAPPDARAALDPALRDALRRLGYLQE